MPRPSLDEILAVCGRASFGDLTARVKLDGPADEDPTTILAFALNILLGDLEHRATQLQRSEAKFRRLVESNVIGVMVAGLDGRILEANDAFLGMLGRTREEVAAGTLRAPDITPPGWETFGSAARRALHEEGRFEPMEKEYLARDGSRVPVLVGGALLPDQPDQVIAFALDLRETREARAALDASNARYRMLFERSPQPMYVFDTGTSAFLDVNEAMVRTYGWTREEFLRMSIFDIRPPEERDRLAVTLRSLPPRITSNGAWRHLRKDGTSLDVLISSDMMVIDSRVARLVIIEDVTARLAAERELEAARVRAAHAEKLAALGSLVSGVAHEIRTPLTYIANHAFLLERRAASGSLDGVEAIVREIHAGIDRINALVVDLRSYTRGEPGERHATSVHVPVMEAIKLFEATHRGKATLEADARPTREVRLDARQVQQVVLNLLQNAAESMPQGGRILVRTWDDGAHAVIEVADEGGGIPEDLRGHVYEPLVTTKPGGTGLGLDIVRRITEAHHGSVTFDTACGKGTTFRVRLPVEAPAPAPSALEPR